jgi:hypothetical protein
MQDGLGREYGPLHDEVAPSQPEGSLATFSGRAGEPPARDRWFESVSLQCWFIAKPAPRREEVLDFLREYHRALGPLVSQFEGRLDQFSGDGIMVFFNDPVP